MGIHYNYKAKRGERAMAKAKKRKDKKAKNKAKRAPLSSDLAVKPKPYADIDKVITLDDLTSPEEN